MSGKSGKETEDLRLAALRRQGPTLKLLLQEAKVPLQDAASMLCEILRGIPPDAHLIAMEILLVARVDRACADYARARGLAYMGLAHPSVRALHGAAGRSVQKQSKNRRR